MARKNITIRDDQEEWLDEHESLNLSGLVRDVLDEVREQYEVSEAVEGALDDQDTSQPSVEDERTI